MHQTTVEIDTAKLQKVMQLGEFISEKDAVSFALTLANWYLTHKAEDWTVQARKGEEIKTVQIRGM